MTNNNTYTPHKWLVIDCGNDLYKVFAVWSGGYLDGDSWKLNSGIKNAEDMGDHYIIHGYSTSKYKCYKKNYGTNIYGTSLLSNMESTILSNTQTESLLKTFIKK